MATSAEIIHFKLNICLAIRINPFYMVCQLTNNLYLFISTIFLTIIYFFI